MPGTSPRATRARHSGYFEGATDPLPTVPIRTTGRGNAKGLALNRLRPLELRFRCDGILLSLGFRAMEQETHDSKGGRQEGH